MNSSGKLVAGAFVTWLAFATTGEAAKLRVPQDHATIQEALIAAAAGDTVLVSPGRYPEYVGMKAGVVLRSLAGPDSTTIASPELRQSALDEKLVVFPEGADRSTVLEGFTLACGPVQGAAVFCENGSPTIRRNVIRGFGWGINLRYADPLLEDNVVADCSPFGILMLGSSPLLRGNTITGNKPQAISIAGKKSNPVIGGRREYANRIYGNEASISNTSRNDIDARFNDWGWAVTAEMEQKGYPENITTILDGRDRGSNWVGKGTVDYSSWIEPREASDREGPRASAPPAAPASADTLASASGAEAKSTPPATSPSSSRPVGTRWLVPGLLALGVVAVFVIVSRRGSS